MDGYPEVRLRRLRRTAAIRDMFGMDAPSPAKFIWPVFVVPGAGRREAIDSMPGQFRLSADELVRELEPVVAQGVRSVLLFGQHEGEGKDECGTPAADPHGAVQRAIPVLRRAYPDLVILTDVCLCAYTAHGHCGPHDLDGDIDNDAACEMLARVAVSHAQAGADGVAPSAMMDGQVAAIRRALDEEGFKKTLLIAYSTKFASQMYGPFRDAENSAPSQGDRQGYQASYRDPRTALRESDFDAAEGADALMGVAPLAAARDGVQRVGRVFDDPRRRGEGVLRPLRDGPRVALLDFPRRRGAGKRPRRRCARRCGS